jgi:hypothetical protein
MSRLTGVLCVLTMALAVSSTCVARADESDSVETGPSHHEGVWTIDGRAGYAASWSTGVSHLGMGEGLAVGRTFPSRVHVEIQGLHFHGEEARAGNESLVYRAEYASTQLQAAFGYELALGILRVRPGVQSGVSFVSGHTSVGTVQRRDDIARWMVGPSVTVLVHVAQLVVGVDAQAFFVPTAVAAPAAGLYGVLGIEL